MRAKERSGLGRVVVLLEVSFSLFLFFAVTNWFMVSLFSYLPLWKPPALSWESVESRETKGRRGRFDDALSSFPSQKEKKPEQAHDDISNCVFRRSGRYSSW